MLKTDILTGELKDVLKASIAENVILIKSIGETYHKQVEGAVYRAITSAQGGEALVPFLERYKGMTQRRARNIANDQSLKAFASINRARLEKLGIGRYEWLHTAGSQHPRRLHVSYSGRIFSWDSPRRCWIGRPALEHILGRRFSVVVGQSQSSISTRIFR